MIMAEVPAHDLRSEAKDYKRVREHSTKWARGSRHATGHYNCPKETQVGHHEHCDECHKRPSTPGYSRNFTDLRRTWNGKVLGKRSRAIRGTVVDTDEDVFGLSDSSGDLDVNDVSAAPELKEVMYSFDAPTGPSRGGDVLSFAITQAVQRFENNETEKIVKNEYDLVLDGKDEPESTVADADDDFELIDVSHLK